MCARRALQLEQKWPVDLLDIDTAVLHRLESVGQLDQLAAASGAVLIRTLAKSN